MIEHREDILIIKNKFVKLVLICMKLRSFKQNKSLLKLNKKILVSKFNHIFLRKRFKQKLN
jgi:hypothetical protein